MKLTEHFTLEELTYSATAIEKKIKNDCPEELIDNIIKMATVLEALRTFYKLPVTILSCYRSPELNTACGGSKTSSHLKALAVDLRINTVSNISICRKIPELLVNFDQVIYEFGPKGWVHLGIDGNRKQLLSAIKSNGKTVYIDGFV